MEKLLDDLLNGESSEKVFENWSESNKINTSSENFKYLISELSVSFNFDLTDFSTNLKSNHVFTWPSLKDSLVNFFKNPDSFSQDELIEKASRKTLKLIVLEELTTSLNTALAEKSSNKIPRKPTESWISPFIAEYEQEVLSILSFLDEEKNGLIVGSQLRNLLVRMLNAFNITPSEKDLFLFERMVENRYKQASSERLHRYKYLKLTYSQCLSLIEEWALKESYKQFSVKSKVKDTIYEYELLLGQVKEFPEIVETVQGIINNLRGINSKNSVSQGKDIGELQSKGAKEVFSFYARQIKMVGQFPTFTQLTDHKIVLNLSKFTKFCSDFELISTTREKYKISLKDISNIFIKATNCQRVMTYDNFVDALEQLSEAYYSDQYDMHYHENLSLLATDEKKRRLMLLLHFEDPAIYTERLKGFGQAFSIERKGYRLPENDLSKRYKYKDQTKVKQKIELWKQQKAKMESPARSKSVPSHARIKAIQQSLLMRPDRVTWDMLSKNYNFISKEELSMILDPEDINELIRNGIKLM